MKITVEADAGSKFGHFHINLHSKDGAEPFLTIKNCKLIDRTDGGRFVSFPAKKIESSGKWWNYVWANEGFQEAVRAAWDATLGPNGKAPRPALKPAAPRVEQKSLEEMDNDPPF